MLLSDLIYTNRKNYRGPRVTQRCKVKCDNCEKEFERSYIYLINGRNNYHRDLCHSCMQIEQNKQGLRKEQYIKAGEAFKNKYSGKKLEEIVELKKSIEIRKNHSKMMTGNGNPNFDGKYSNIGNNYSKKYKGKSFEEIHGKEKSKLLRKNLSEKFSGKNNPMYGKPSPKGSGNGWSGWYKEWYFRSLLELSFMINVIEKQNLQWDSGEKSEYNIHYIDWEGKNKTYFPDFVLENSKIIEIKPSNLRNSKNVLLKENAAIIWCNEHNFEYQIIESDNIQKLNVEEIKQLHDSGVVKFIYRYEKKYKEKYNARI